MKLHSYVVARDFGFAPNPFFGVCTLATCKPRIRSVAQVGDWVVGTGSKQWGNHYKIVYVMRVTSAMSFNEYWADPQYAQKKPNLQGSKMQAFGDNIYHRTSPGASWWQLNSHHSLDDGQINSDNVENDTQTDRVLISNDFTYWGGSGPNIPNSFLDFGPSHINLCAVRNHKNDFPPEFVERFVSWVRSLNDKGYVGEPLDWVRTA